MPISLVNKEKAGPRQVIVSKIECNDIAVFSVDLFLYSSDIKFPFLINLLQWKASNVIATKN